MHRSISLPEVIDLIWNDLEAGRSSPNHDFYLPSLTTITPTGPACRTVVLRHVDPAAHTLTCYTDIRSDKVSEIRTDPRTEWQFYSRERKIQIRAAGKTTVLTEGPFVDAAWEAVPASNLSNYLSVLAPGSPSLTPTSGLLDGLVDRCPTEEELASARSHFAVIRTEISRFDWLWLGSRGHLRARFDRDGSEFIGTWLVP